jgi:HPt (histidine-containing phosphotransfer) domain-containing protein
VKPHPEEVTKPILGISRADADLELLIELVGISQAAFPVLLRDLQAAVASGDLRSIRRGARLMKAAAKSISAERTYDAANRLEVLARRRRAQGLLEAVRNLQRELEGLEPVLAAFAESLRSSPEAGPDD